MAALLSLVTPILMWMMFLALGMAYSGYNLLTRAASDLGAAGSPHATTFDVGFFALPGLFTAMVGVALLLIGVRSWCWRLGAAAVAAAGLLLFSAAFFPDRGGPPGAATIHQAVTQICFALAAAAPLFMLWGSRAIAIPVLIRRLWLASGCGAILVEVGVPLLRAHISLPEGAFQRPLLLSLTVWFVTVAIWLNRRAIAPALLTVPINLP